MDRETLVKSAILTFLTLALAEKSIMPAHALPEEKVEKCYGIVKAGMNDCQTATSSCAGSATQDKQADAFILLPEGICHKIVGGSLTAKSVNIKDTKDKK